MNRKPIHLVALLIVVTALLAGCGSPAEPQIEEATAAPTQAPVTEESTSEAPTQEETAPEPTEKTQEAAEAEIPWTADGVITAGEYTDEATIKTLNLWWRHDGEYLYLAMEGPTQGWISIGIDPSTGMQDADYLFGFVSDGKAQLWDAYGTAPRGANHPPDEELGGSNNIIAFAGVEQDSITRFELQIPLNSGDDYDKVLEPGTTYPIIVALGSRDEYNGFHNVVGRGELILQ